MRLESTPGSLFFVNSTHRYLSAFVQPPSEGQSSYVFLPADGIPVPYPMSIGDDSRSFQVTIALDPEADHVIGSPLPIYVQGPFSINLVLTLGLPQGQQVTVYYAVNEGEPTLLGNVDKSQWDNASSERFL